MARKTHPTEPATDPGSRRLNRRQVLAGLGTTGVIGLAGCTSISGNNNRSDSRNTGDLPSQVKQEGKLILYSVIDSPALNETIIPAFKKDYQWAEVETVGMGPSKISSRVASEYQANQVKADVAWNTQAPMEPLKSKGVFRNVTNISELVHAFQTNEYPHHLNNKYSVPAIQNPQTIIYNTNSLSDNEVPRSYENWTNNKWKNRLVLDHPRMLNVAGGEFVSLSSMMNKPSWRDIMNGIASNNPRLTQSASEVYRIVAAGEADLGIGLINNYLAGQQKNNPPAVGIAWIKPHVSLNVPLYLTKNAPNPAMAVLFARWLMSPSGQIAAAKTGNTPTQPQLAQATFSEYMPTDLKLRPVASNTPSYFENPDKWVNQYENIFG